LPGLNGPVDLAALQGQVVLLDFWASWCTPCKLSFPWMNALQTRLGPRGLQVVAVNLDRQRSAADLFGAGFGVADLVWIGWTPNPNSGEFTALSLERQMRRRLLHAFEGKLKDWRRALQQAFRYRYFADKAIVVMPWENADAAIANLEAFRNSGVGLWSFDSASGLIREHYTPTRIRAFSSATREKAIRALSSEIDFRQFCK
jgi:thiol-disulfide isomerase/thioredoxin